ncbi:hypothetical protein NM688_g1982 [Phlebia brevispora]|uniref:Uncharacterized protein n=1 Tax=Phlebia brevispora TaxID=194682 RepID=A0ACC1TA94_9APHY|nr:hypothetical protein NM688_g1982 [Phlebia brevispora]
MDQMTTEEATRLLLARVTSPSLSAETVGLMPAIQVFKNSYPPRYHPYTQKARPRRLSPKLLRGLFVVTLSQMMDPPGFPERAVNIMLAWQQMDNKLERKLDRLVLRFATDGSQRNRQTPPPLETAMKQQRRLAVPSRDRPRRGVRYPSVAQNKNVPDRALYDDLDWRKHAVLHSDVGDREPVKRSAETKREAPGRNFTNSSLIGLLVLACEAAIAKTMSQHRQSLQKKPLRPRLNILHWSEDQHVSDPSPHSSRCGSTSSASSSSSTTPSSELRPAVRAWG